VSQAAAISMNDSRFAPAPGPAGSTKPASAAVASGPKPGISLARLEMKLSRRARILSTGLLMVATSFGLSMLIVALTAL
jgi:hypothetical protein